MSIRTFGEHIENRVGVLLDEIERERKRIIANARLEAMMKLHEAEKISQDIIERANRYLQQKLQEINDTKVINETEAS